MTINTSQALSSAYREYQMDLAQAVKFTHPDYTHSGTNRERARRVEAARKKFAARIPAKADDALLADRRPGVLAGLAPKTADQVALRSGEWATVQAALGSGRILQEVLLQATSVERVAAILDHAEEWSYGLETNDPAGAAQSIRDLAYDRLLALDYQPAVSAQAAADLHGGLEAWRQVMSEAALPESAQSYEAASALFQADPEGFQAISEANAVIDPMGDVAREVSRLDQLVASGEVKLTVPGASA